MLRFLPVILLCQLAAAVDHGPFVQWYHDPCHEAEIRWVDRGSQASVMEGRWATGSAGFGYADHDDATAFPGMKDHYTSIALRHQISLQKKPQAGNQLVAEILYDDGFVLFIDGKEVLRKNAIGVDAAIQSGGAHEAEKWERFPLGEAAGLIKDGSIIAVQVVNDKIGSSDLSFDMSLTIQGKHSVSVIQRKATWQYLAKTPPTGAWKTEFPALNEVVAPQAETSYLLGYRVAGEMDWQWQSARSHRLAQSDSRVFAVSLERLKADTRYEFVIRPKNSDALHGPHVIRTAPEAFRPMHFVIGGDMYHSRPLLDAMNKRAGLEDPLFAALIGDLAYANDQHVQRWYEWIDSWVQNAKAPDGRLIPMVIGMGNHEVLGNGYVPEKNTPGPEKSTQFYSLFRMGQRGDRAISYYNLDFGNYLSLVLLDSGHTQRISEQVDFVRDSLMSRRQVPFVFAAYHRPAWGAGVKENAVDIQQRWCPLFESLGVDAVFEHDHHCYKRTWPLIAGKRDDAKGIPYLGDGAWGVSVRKPDAQTRAKRPWVAQDGAVNHFFRVTLREQDFHCEAMSADGKVFDQAVYPKRP